MPPTTIDPTPLDRQDLFMFDLMHRGMRRDSAALRDAVAVLATGDRKGATALARWYRSFLATIVHHHTVEDEVFWPAIGALVPGFTATETALTDDHHRLDVSLAAVTDALAALERSAGAPAERAAATAACAGLADLLDEHLDREEGTVFPVLLGQVPAAEYAPIHEQSLARGDTKSFPWLAPWLLDHATPAEETALRASAPRIAFVLHRLVWRRRYERGAAPVRAQRAQPAGATGSATRSGRGVTATTAAALAVLAIAALATGCGRGAGAAADPTAPGAGPGGHAGHPAPPAGVIDVAMGEYGFTLSQPTVPAGVVTFRVTNTGHEPHQLQVARTVIGVNAENFPKLHASQGESKLLNRLDWVGGLNAIEPGATSEVKARLEPGDHLVACFMPAPDGDSHIAKKMVAPLKVTAGEAPAATPTPDEVITVKDFAIDVPEGFTGKGTVGLRNTGPQIHEVALLRMHDGKSVADGFAWYGSGRQGPPPFDYAGGVGTVTPGREAWASMDLPAGEYVAACFLPDAASGQPHAVLGMVKPFTIH